MSPDELASCAQAATLAHDIGNPPFGHSGEEAIQKWFTEESENRSRKPIELTDAQKQDFLQFNGNAQGFRVLTQFRYGDKRPGLHLTCAALGAFLKYPAAAGQSSPWKKPPGLFHSDAKLYRTIAAELRIPMLHDDGLWMRHPVAFLVEAADDAAYMTADIEDGVELALIPREKAEKLFSEFLTDDDKSNFGTDYSVLAKYRSKTIGKLLKIAIDEFKENYRAIMSGAHMRPLLDEGCHKGITRLREEAKNSLLCSSALIRREYGGQQALEGLLKHFALTTCRFRDVQWNLEVLRKDRDNPASREAWRLLSLARCPGDDGSGAMLGTGLPRTEYEMLHYVTDFIAGQTDRYAAQLWKNLKGIDV